MTDDEIRERALAEGFKRKLQPDGSMDLSPYVFNAIRACQPTRVYELTFDYGDGYITIFMTTDKQSAVKFIESVKSADKDFVGDYGFNDDDDEVLVEQYEQNHPLKPYAKEIFNMICEDSFDEYVLKYNGYSFASDLRIIEHDLWAGLPDPLCNEAKRRSS